MEKKAIPQSISDFYCKVLFDENSKEIERDGKDFQDGIKVKHKLFIWARDTTKPFFTASLCRFPAQLCRAVL